MFTKSCFFKIEASGNNITITRLVQIANVLQVSLTDLLEVQQKPSAAYHTTAQQIITGVVNGTNYGAVHPEESNKQLILALQSRIEKLENDAQGKEKDS